MRLLDKFAGILYANRRNGSPMPFNALLALFNAAKMKIHSSLTDVPFAITDAVALSVAKEQNKWCQHPYKKRKTQEIAFVDSLGAYWNIVFACPHAGDTKMLQY